MNSYLRFPLIVCLALMFSGCNRGGDDPAKPAPPTPAPQGTQTSEQKNPPPVPPPTSSQLPEGSKNPEDLPAVLKPANNAPASDMSVVTSPANNQPEDSRANLVVKFQPNQSVPLQIPPVVGVAENVEKNNKKGHPDMEMDVLNNRWEQARDLFKGKAIAVGAAVNPTQDSILRREWLEDTRAQSEEVRKLNFAALQNDVVKTLPIDKNETKQALQGRTEPVISLLEALLTESNPARIGADASQVVEEFFDEPGYERIKIAQFQLALRELARVTLYNDDSSKRIAYVQAMMDNRLQSDQQAELVKRDAFIALGALAVYPLAAFHTGQAIREGIWGEKGWVNRVGRGGPNSGRWVGRKFANVTSLFGVQEKEWVKNHPPFLNIYRLKKPSHATCLALV